mgnify:FL=1
MEWQAAKNKTHAFLLCVIFFSGLFICSTVDLGDCKKSSVGGVCAVVHDQSVFFSRKSS